MLLQTTAETQTTHWNIFQQYVYISRYARYLHDKSRRETWPETVTRYFDFFANHLKEKFGYTLTKELRGELEGAVLNFEVMPSMRCIMTAGPALERENIAAFNCSYLSIDHPKSFAEMMYILLNGTGVGYSVERQYVNKLPEVPEEFYPSETVVVVGDSKLGWAKSLNELISILYTGNIPKWDLSKVRPAGAILKTFGGRASGPEPLERLFKFMVQTFKDAKGRKLTSIDCHDICCQVADTIVVGGVRRSALISLSNLSDDRMRNAKTGQWWALYPYRSLANNSAVYTEKQPTMDTFMNEWKSLYDSKSGERGIFSRWASKRIIENSNSWRVEHFGKDARLRESESEWGTNPCSEIILRDKEFCNLSEIVARAGDNEDELKRKARIAAILGTFQSTLTDFKFISSKWKNNTEDERLLGVSITGIMDNKLTSNPDTIPKLCAELKKVVIKTNMELAKKLGIPSSVATTCVKPSGTVSSLVDSASGIHARHSPYYMRTVRSDKKDPLAQLLIDQGVHCEPDAMRPDHNLVFSFPTKSPRGAICRNDMDAMKQLQVWMLFQKHWTEHKPSITVSIKENEWLKVGSWVFDNFEYMSGVSFLPFSEHSYQQAPFQDLTEEQYKEWVAKTPKVIAWDKLPDYEKEDTTTSSQELACTAGAGQEGVVEVGCNI